jgi:hypothetical protein
VVIESTAPTVMIERITLKFCLEIFDIAVLLRAIGAVSNRFSNEHH